MPATQRLFDGTREQRRALRAALKELNAKRISDERIAILLERDVTQGRIPGFQQNSVAPVTRPTIQRIRTADDEALFNVRPSTAGVLYNFLTQSEELRTSLFDSSVKVHSEHTLAPLLEALKHHVGATEGPLNNPKMKSLKGNFYLYRKAWTSFDADTYVRCVLSFDWVGDALFYSEEQKFYDTVAQLPVDEKDHGLVLPYGMNVILMGKGERKDLLKFFSFHDFTPYPDGHQKVHAMSGNFIAVYSKGPHPGFQAFARRVPDDEEPIPKFYAEGELDETIRNRLTGRW